MSFMILAIFPDKKHRKLVRIYDLLHLRFAGGARDLHMRVLAVCHDMILARFVTKQTKTIKRYPIVFLL